MGGFSEMPGAANMGFPMQSALMRTSLPRMQYPIPRRHRRYLFSVPVVIHRSLPEGNITSNGLSLEISEGGMSAAVCGPPPVGEAVGIELRLPDGRFEAPAVVRYNNKTQSGFQFLVPSPELVRRVSTSTQELPARNDVFVVT